MVRREACRAHQSLCLCWSRRQVPLYEDEGTNYNYEKGKYATIDLSYDEATKTLTIGKRNGSFSGMLKNRRFNIVLVTKDKAQPLNLIDPAGKMVDYSGKEMKVAL